MAKRPPSGTDGTPHSISATATLEPPASPAPGPKTDLRAVMVEFPLHRTDAYAMTNLGDLPRRTAQQLRNLTDGLIGEGLKLESGKAIKDSRDAVIWLCEQLEAGLRQ